MEKALRQIESNCIRVVLFGPESSGKTTLAKELAARYKTEWVPEYMRSYLENKWDEIGEKVNKLDLVPIAKGQLELENDLVQKASTFLFCDTNVLELKVYSEYYYKGYCPEEILRACKETTYDYYFLTQVDIPWEADNLRDRPYDRSTLFTIFEEELKRNNLPYSLLEGGVEERIQQAAQVLAKLKNKPNAHRKGHTAD